MSLPVCVFNYSAAAVMAGYSVSSAKWQGYRLKNSVAVMVFIRWEREREDLLMQFPHAETIWPNEHDLKKRLSKFGIKVHKWDVKKALYNAPDFDLNIFNTKHDKELAKMLMPKRVYHKGNKTIIIEQ